MTATFRGRCQKCGPDRVHKIESTLGVDVHSCMICGRETYFYKEAAYQPPRIVEGNVRGTE